MKTLLLCRWEFSLAGFCLLLSLEVRYAVTERGGETEIDQPQRNWCQTSSSPSCWQSQHGPGGGLSHSRYHGRERHTRKMLDAAQGGPPFPHVECYSPIHKSSCNQRRTKCPWWGSASYAHRTSLETPPGLPVSVPTPTRSSQPNHGYTSKTSQRTR